MSQDEFRRKQEKPNVAKTTAVQISKDTFGKTIVTTKKLDRRVSFILMDDFFCSFCLRASLFTKFPDSYDDCNFFLEDDEANQYLLKIHNGACASSSFDPSNLSLFLIPFVVCCLLFVASQEWRAITYR
jgi:hypothetical protein